MSTKVLNQAVKRNDDRFPADLMCQLTAEEFTVLRSQIVSFQCSTKQAIRQLITPPEP
ncbi:MAG: ORF6N domain-containing protein, partial [Candidatus Binatia bacterium]